MEKQKITTVKITTAKNAKTAVFERAEKLYDRAIEILIQNGENPGEIAVTHVNKAHLYHQLSGDEERIEQELENLLPKARILRMDTDTANSKYAHHGTTAKLCPLNIAGADPIKNPNMTM